MLGGVCQPTSDRVNDTGCRRRAREYQASLRVTAEQPPRLRG